MSGAAVTLGYTTGAVSQQMAALARAVGRPLFLRDGARLALSDDATVLVGQARLVLEAEARAAAVLRGLERLEGAPPEGLGDVGAVAVACALGYLDFRFAQLDWRTPHPNLRRLAEQLAERPSFKVTAPPPAA